MDLEMKEFLLGMEARINKRFDEQDKKFAEQDKRLAGHDKRFDELEAKIEEAIKQIIHDIALEFHSVTDVINGKINSNYEKNQNSIKELDLKISQQSEILSKGFKQIADDIDTKIAM